MRGEDTLAGWNRGWGINILEGASSVLYICKYFVLTGYRTSNLTTYNQADALMDAKNKYETLLMERFLTSSGRI